MGVCASAIPETAMARIVIAAAADFVGFPKVRSVRK
jgi:hypothetical protein